MSAFNRNILIVKFGALGDVVRTSYLLPALAARYPEARIYWLTADSALELLRFNPHIYALVSPGAGFDPLRNLEFDFAISLDDERDVLARLATLKVARVIGARLEDEKRTYCAASAAWFGMGLISHHGKVRADELKRENLREHQTFLEEMAGVQINQASFFNSPTLETRVKALFAPEYFHVGLNSGSGARWPSKQLRIPEAVALVRRLIALQVNGRPIKVWLLGGKDEAQRHADIRAAVESSQVIDTGFDQNILEFSARIKALDYLITTDSLALHLGIAQGVPNLSFYAPTSAAEIGTFGTGTKVISTAADYCNYKPYADNSSITSERIGREFQNHLAGRGLSVSESA